MVYDKASKELTATLTNAKGAGLSSTTLTVKVGRTNYSVKTNSRGTAKLSFENLTYGTYAATVSYNGNSRFNPSNASVIVNTKIDTSISLVYDVASKELVATLTTADGLGLSSTTVNINVDGVDYAVKTNSKGIAKLSTADLAPGSYVASASYNGNGRFNPSNASIDMKIKTDTIISLVYDSTSKMLVATLSDVEGNAISDVLLFDIDGEIYSFMTDSVGQAKFSTKFFMSGNYATTISYEGNEDYNPTSTTEVMAIS